MYLMARPPYLRWALAASLVLIGAMVECGGDATVPHPYSQTDIVRGSEFTDDVIEWRHIPAGLLAKPALAGRVAAVDIPAGTALVDAIVADGAVVPRGWWAMALKLPAATRPGAEVLVILTESGVEIPGIVVEAADDGGFGIEDPGVVAVPAASAVVVARAAATGVVVVATRP